MTTYSADLTGILDREPLPASGIDSGEVEYHVDGSTTAVTSLVRQGRGGTRESSSCTTGSG